MNSKIIILIKVKLNLRIITYPYQKKKVNRGSAGSAEIIPENKVSEAGE